MVIAYHAVFTTYGTWLPNDPRGSYSEKVYAEELRTLGDVKYGRQDPQPPRDELRRFWTTAREHLRYPPFFLDDRTRTIVARGFAEVVGRLNLTVHACAIMNDHVHLVVGRSDYRIEYIVNQFKGAATKAMALPRTPWARGRWKVFLNDPPALAGAIEYVQKNPVLAGWGSQQWDFVRTAFRTPA